MVGELPTRNFVILPEMGDGPVPSGAVSLRTRFANWPESVTIGHGESSCVIVLSNLFDGPLDTRYQSLLKDDALELSVTKANSTICLWYTLMGTLRHWGRGSRRLSSKDKDVGASTSSSNILQEIIDEASMKLSL